MLGENVLQVRCPSWCLTVLKYWRQFNSRIYVYYILNTDLYITTDKTITKYTIRLIPSSPCFNWINGISKCNFLRGIVFALLEENIVVNTCQQERGEQYHKCELPANRKCITTNLKALTKDYSGHRTQRITTFVCVQTNS